MNAHHLDTVLQEACPTVMVPMYGQLAPMAKSGQRFLSASDGLWVEVSRPWLHIVWPVATQNDFPTPYGKLEKKIDLAFGKIPVDLINLFIADAEAAFPNEFGAWLIWDDNAKQLRYQSMRTIAATPVHLEAERPDIAEHESLAINLHSHGRGHAFFSSDDDADDRGEVKISGVFGSLHRTERSAVFRVCRGQVYQSWS